jgi:hypothetical protein
VSASEWVAALVIIAFAFLALVFRGWLKRNAEDRRRHAEDDPEGEAW